MEKPLGNLTRALRLLLKLATEESQEERKRDNQMFKRKKRQGGS